MNAAAPASVAVPAGASVVTKALLFGAATAGVVAGTVTGLGYDHLGAVLAASALTIGTIGGLYHAVFDHGT